MSEMPREMAEFFDGTQAQAEAYERLRRAQEEADPEQILADVVADFDRRRANPWGRFLLWLLRKTT